MFEVKNPYNTEPNTPRYSEFMMHDCWRVCHKATLKAVVKWLDEPCNDHLKGLGSPRRYCASCIEELRKAAEGQEVVNNGI